MVYVVWMGIGVSTLAMLVEVNLGCYNKIP